ncbi:MAG: RluA family pseudouridine synthase [Armatimonadota bacterium]|nr:RluA family pseudouridine synthase [Armatimonadota bacterium]
MTSQIKPNDPILSGSPPAPVEDDDLPGEEFVEREPAIPIELRAPGGLRLDIWLTEALGDVSRAEVQRWIRQGAVLVEGRKVRASDQPAAGQRVTVNPPPPTPSTMQPESLPLTIVYEDEDLLVVDKASGMTVHPGAAAHSGTLVHALLAHCGNLSVIGGEERPGIVHRLDKETSGLLVVAKNDKSHRALASQIAQKTAGREYQAVAWGSPPWNHATVRAPIGRDSHHRTRMTVLPEEEGGRFAETELDVQERLRIAFVLRATLSTGRTHQIRVHCAYSGYPLVGDAVYGPAQLPAIHDAALRSRLESVKRQALHACMLSFNHPRSGERVEFRREPPEDWQAILRLVRQI